MIIDSSFLVGTTSLSGSFEITGSSLPGSDNLYDLGSSTKRWRNIYVANISGSLTGSGLEANSIVFAGTGGVLTGSLNQFSYNPSTGNVAIGTNVALYRLDVGGTIHTSNDISANGTIYGGNASITNTLTSPAISGSLTKLSNGSSYLIAGTNVTITTGSSGAVTISSTSPITGTGTTNYVTKWTSTTALGTGLIYDDGSGVGIGTTTYTARLLVSGSSTASTPTLIVREGVASPIDGVGVLNVQNSSGTSILFVSGSGLIGIGTTSPVSTLSFGNFAGSAGTANKISFYSSGTDSISGFGVSSGQLDYVSFGAHVWYSRSGGVSTERVRIDSLGNVGIGTNNANSNRLAISGGNLSVTGSVLPGVTNSYDLGTSTYSWRDLYARSGSFSGDVSISGNLNVLGTQVIINSTTIELKDNIILLNAGPSPQSTGGIYVADNSPVATTNTGSLVWDTSTDRWKAGFAGNETNVVLTGSVDSLFNKTITIQGSTANIISGGTVGAIGFFNSSGYLSSSVVGTSGQVLLSGGSGSPTWSTFGTLLSGSSVITGSGTANYSARYTSPNAITTGTIYDNGSAIGVGTTVLGTNIITVFGTSAFTGSILPGTDNTYDLGSLSKRWRNIYAANISGSLTGSGLEANSIVFAGAGGVLTGSLIGLNYNPSSGRVGIGTGTPNYPLEVIGNIKTSATLYANDANITTILTSPAISGSHTKLSDGTSYLIAGTNVTITTGSNGAVTIASTSPITGTGVTNYVTKWSSATGLTYGIIYDNGTNVGIGTTVTSDKLAVNGSMSVTGSLLPGSDATYDLGSSTKRWNNLFVTNISGSLTGSNLLAGQVVYAGTGGVLTGSSVFLFDKTNNRVGIGTTSLGTQRLAVYGSTSAFGGTTFEALNSSATSLLYVGDNGNVGINTNNPTSVRLRIVGETNTMMTNALECWNSSSTTLFTVRNDGNVGVGTQMPAYTLEVNGSFAATTKSFVISHPTRPGWKLRYGSLESPYHGIRLTGEAEVVDGRCEVLLPDYISMLCKQEGAQVQITNLGHSKTMWIDSIDVGNNKFTVRTKNYFFTRFFEKQRYRFFWSFTAVRKDIEDMVVEFNPCSN